MAQKLARNAMPPSHTRDDFECFGPVANRDTDFANCKLADLGCFKQDEGTDSNKYYHAAVVKSKKNGTWGLYVEYGRTKDGVPSSPQFQFTVCSNESEAMGEFASQCDSKNTKRGQWEQVGSKERYVPRTKKDGTTEDLYVVRYMASRSVGLPAAKGICNADATGSTVATTTKAKTSAKRAVSKIDIHTRKLFSDLLGGAISYTRATIVGNTMPAAAAISDARDLLQDAMAAVKKVGSNVKNQVADPTLKKLTYALYGMIPKVKPPSAQEKDWILSQDNIIAWQNDLDAFETALKSANVNVEDHADDHVMQGIPATMEWVDPKSELGKHTIDWWVGQTRNRHGHAKLQIHNLWKVDRHGDDKIFNNCVEETLGQMPKTWNNERPFNVDRQKQRPDLSVGDRKKYWSANVALSFHGTRAVNVPGIIRENLRFPNQLVGVVINGAMFGPGSYFADDWGKSAGYCSRSHGSSLYAGSSGHVNGRRSFMFGFDVALGNPHVAKDAHGFTEPPKGCHCVFGKAGHTNSWASSSGLQNNEWIIYRRNRIQMKYLAELSWY